MSIDIAYYEKVINDMPAHRAFGTVSEIIGVSVHGHDPGTALGEMCEIRPEGLSQAITAEVVGYMKGKVLLMPLDNPDGICPGSKIFPLGRKASVGVGQELLGRVMDGLGNPIDGKAPLNPTERYPIYAEPINPMKRARITEPMDLGIRAVNGLFTCGKGQRMGIFSGSGVGKSVLLGMIARNTQADVNVIGLIGERGREVREFIENNLGEEGLKRSVVVVATSDSHPLIRLRAAYAATSVAEYFRNQGSDVLLMVDSLTRFAMAQREIGLLLGEPPTSKGYTPSVFSILPRLLERSGNIDGNGSITGLYTVLVEGDDFNEPIADCTRSILDGHINLSRDLAAKNHYPAVDILRSISRVMIDVTDKEQQRCAGELMNIIATYRKAEDLINIGAYVAGSNRDIDYAISMIDRIDLFLKQDIDETVTMDESRAALFQLFDEG